MKDLSTEKVKLLAEKNGWSLMHAEGYLDGETFRRRSKAPSTYVRVGIDDYSLGFRAGYYERRGRSSDSEAQILPVVRLSAQVTRDVADASDVITISARVG